MATRGDLNYALNELGKLGISREQAYGILGSLAGESGRGLNTRAINPNDPGGSYGIGQWHSGRKRGLFNLAAKTGRKKSDFRAQVDWMVHELKTTHKPALNAVKAAKNRYQAARAWTNKFELPKAKYARHERRNQNADYFAKSLSGADVEPITADVSLTGATLPDDPRASGLLAGFFAEQPEEQAAPSAFQGLLGISPAAASEMPQPASFNMPAAATRAPSYGAQTPGLMPGPVQPNQTGLYGLQPPSTSQEMALAHLMSPQADMGQPRLSVEPKDLNPQFSTAPSPGSVQVDDFGWLAGMNKVGGLMAPDPNAVDPSAVAALNPGMSPEQIAGEFGPQSEALAYAEPDAARFGPTIQAAYKPGSPTGPRGAMAAGPYDEKTVSPPETDMAGTPVQYDETSFPPAPDQPKEKQGLLDDLFSPETKAGMALGSMLGLPGMVGGGLLGRMMAGSGGLLGGNPMAGPVSAADRYGVGSGVAGMTAGMYGPRGATGYSRSNPGAFVTSRGPQYGWDLTNQFGATTHYSPSGNIMATRDSNARLGGLLGRMTGGLLGGGMSDRERAEWSGRAGLF